MWMYNQFRVSASLLAFEDLRTQPEIICHKSKSMGKNIKLNGTIYIPENIHHSCNY